MNELAPDPGAERSTLDENLERYGSAGALALVTLGFVLRARGLSQYWLNPDEGAYYYILLGRSLIWRS
jgi:hypothetical protein